jgi:hypothetical protein
VIVKGRLFAAHAAGMTALEAATDEPGNARTRRSRSIWRIGPRPA